MALQYGAYIAMAGIGLYAIFAGEMISILNYMLEPAVEQTLEDDFLKPPVYDAPSKILQFISIGVAPGLVMSGTAYMIARKFGSKQIGMADNYWRFSIVNWYVLFIYNVRRYRKRLSGFHCYDNTTIIHGCINTNYDCRLTFISDQKKTKKIFLIMIVSHTI